MSLILFLNFIFQFSFRQNNFIKDKALLCIYVCVSSDHMHNPTHLCAFDILRRPFETREYCSRAFREPRLSRVFVPGLITIGSDKSSPHYLFLFLSVSAHRYTLV